MTRFIRHPYFLPSALSVLGIVLLIRVFITDTQVLLPEDVDVMLLVILLGMGMIAAIHTLVRISMGYLRSLSVRSARHETLAEHRRFLQRLDHELKNPLTALQAGLKTLAITDLNEQQRRMVQTMDAETMHLSRLVTDLRKLTELETQPLSLGLMNIEEFANNIVQAERGRFESANRQLKSDVRVSRRQLWYVDEDLLAVAVHNLLDNAFKYSHANDRIILRVDAQHELLIEVADTGVGIPQDELPHIWEELYRTKRIEKIPGSGIGLALVKAIVERHEGTIDVESEIDQGTTVRIRLPFIAQN